MEIVEAERLDHHLSQFSADREENTRKLMEIPGLADTVAVTVGNAIFVPKLPADADKPWKKYTVDIDGAPHLFFHTHTDEPRSLSLCPLMAFTAEGVEYLFRHADAPPELLACVVMARQAQMAYEAPALIEGTP